ncbi:hypothetical protein KEJ51_07280 [Candidatus Bathyarchaeota archaeon]|nr:hypothetical protein [Candidatus Bathyarchaeota archaeon]
MVTAREMDKGIMSLITPSKRIEAEIKDVRADQVLNVILIGWRLAEGKDDGLILNSDGLKIIRLV